MNYGRILTRAWEITWRWKILWVLGFLASLGNGGGGGGGGNANWRIPAGEVPNIDISPQMVGLLVLLACLALIVGIVLWVVSTAARGGLIAGVAQVEDQGTTSFGDAWRAGLRRFWTLFGISVLAALPILVIAILAIVAGVVIFGGISAITSGEGPRNASFAALALCAVPLICIGALLAVVLSQVAIYAERAAMLENLGWLDAFARGWRVLRANIGPTIVFWIIFLVLGLIFAVIFIGGVLAVAAPIIALFVAGGGEPQPWMLLPACVGGLIGIVLAALVGSVVTTFTSATWTLVYRQLTSTPVAPPSPIDA